MVSWKKLFKKTKKKKVKIIKKVIIIKDKRQTKSPGQVLRDRIARRKK